jgi:hypothetical protein
MNDLTLVMTATAFLAGAATAVFVMVVIGIRKADRPRSLPGNGGSPVDAVTQSLLSAGSWPDGVALSRRDAD